MKPKLAVAGRRQRRSYPEDLANRPGNRAQQFIKRQETNVRVRRMVAIQCDRCPRCG
ncbi:hypothetical protein I6A60_13535 [Frankia sp. AgB1.9]|uniref:hypothetical protein n=1 Tax=unclassified Frankia TaxID=2632575 RepID=UPI001933EDCC|nr:MULTISPECIES: hypothetical protein [unclassified Frankia]MBL7494150.1 hypothetical protein [Frankia sp. AgW1.1]MBL7548893.1 hypothetical protein [Frankia sp. AgB1.9]MBL7625198.1 hypothetical protein [Frankia sp. AgB1.8]